MSCLLNFVIVCLVLVGIAEIAARIYFKKHYGIPFCSRTIGEYPYNSFIEKVAAPLHYQFKKGFSSQMVNINRFGCRGPEPAPDGEKKRLLLIGESNFFGVKLRHENEVWDARLRALLRRFQLNEWEIINAGTPIYNSTQHRLYWEQTLAQVKPNIVIIGFGFNDLSQAWMMGSEWSSKVVWPEKFILALERKSPLFVHFLHNFCLYLLGRRKTSERKAFPRYNEDFQWQKCLSLISENYQLIAETAQSRGAQVATIISGFAYDLEPSPDAARALDGIQANWRSFTSGRGVYDISLITEMKKIFRNLKLPCIDLDQTLRHNPRRYQLYLDIGHFNPAGMRIVARTIYHEIEKLGWWQDKFTNKERLNKKPDPEPGGRQ